MILDFIYNNKHFTCMFISLLHKSVTAVICDIMLFAILSFVILSFYKSYVTGYWKTD